MMPFLLEVFEIWFYGTLLAEAVLLGIVMCMDVNEVNGLMEFEFI